MVDDLVIHLYSTNAPICLTDASGLVVCARIAVATRVKSLPAQSCMETQKPAHFAKRSNGDNFASRYKEFVDPFR